MPDGKFQEGTRQAEKSCLTFLKSGERGRLEQILSGGGPRGLREESAGLGLGLEGELLCLSEVARGRPRGEAGEGDRADLQRWVLGKECTLKCFFCFPGWWLGMALGGV